MKRFAALMIAGSMLALGGCASTSDLAAAKADAQRANDAAAKAQPMFTHMPLKLNNKPSSRNARGLLSIDGAMNWGKKAKKNNATLGFKALVQKP